MLHKHDRDYTHGEAVAYEGTDDLRYGGGRQRGAQQCYHYGNTQREGIAEGGGGAC